MDDIKKFQKQIELPLRHSKLEASIRYDFGMLTKILIKKLLNETEET